MGRVLALVKLKELSAARTPTAHRFQTVTERWSHPRRQEHPLRIVSRLSLSDGAIHAVKTHVPVIPSTSTHGHPSSPESTVVLHDVCTTERFQGQGL